MKNTKKQYPKFSLQQSYTDIDCKNKKCVWTASIELENGFELSVVGKTQSSAKKELFKQIKIEKSYLMQDIKNFQGYLKEYVACEKEVLKFFK